MEALFIVPALCSPQTNYKLIPSLAKLIERNILINNAALFKAAAQLKYSESSRFSPKRIFENAEYTGTHDGVPIFTLSEMNIDPVNTKLFQLNEADDTDYSSYSEDELRRLIEDMIDNSQKSGGDQDRYREFITRQFEILVDIDKRIKNTLEGTGNVGDAARLTKIKQEMYEKLSSRHDTTAKNRAEIEKLQAEARMAEKKLSKLDDDLKKASSDKNKEYILKKKTLEAVLGKNSIEGEKINLDRIKHNMSIQYDLELKGLDAQKKKAEIDKINSDTKKNKAQIEELIAKIKIMNKKDDSIVSSGAADINKHGKSFTQMDHIEVPNDIMFFKQISLEPTILEIPIKITTGDSYQINIVSIGVKCVPYTIDSTVSIIKLLTQTKYMGSLERFFLKKIRKFNAKIWFSKARKINKHGDIDPDEAKNTIAYTPNVDELKKPKQLLRAFNNSDSVNWSTMIILSSFDLDGDEELMSIIKNYKKLTKYVFGDIVITNETKESAFFCTPRLNNCQEIQFEYLKKIFNLSNILDYSTAVKQSAWRRETKSSNSNVKTAITDKASSIKSKLNINIPSKINGLFKK